MATADGFASVHALGENGTRGGQDGKTVIVRTLVDLENYATASDPYIIVVAAAIPMDPVGKEIKVVGDKTIIGSGRSGQVVDGAFFLGQGVHNVIIRDLTIQDGRPERQGARHGTPGSATVAVQADDFQARNLTIGEAEPPPASPRASPSRGGAYSRFSSIV